MKHLTRRTFFVCFLGLAVMASTGAQGQQPFVAGDAPIAAQAPLAQGELDALLAPIALYPDQLLAQVLMASTYPIQVVSAARFVQQNPSLTGAALDQALGNENWDPSVISLTAYPQVLLMMNDRLDWTQRLGDAFLADQQQVMDTVQALRSRAQAAGNLQSTPQQTVMDQGGFIDIEPTQPQYVYVPVYDPRVIYGAWPDPLYQPDYWYPPAIYGYPDLSGGIVAGIFFGAPCAIWSNHWGWAHPNWRGRDIDVNVHNNYFANRPQYAGRWGDGRWTHIPDQRNGVAYHASGRQDRVIRPDTTAFQARPPYRGPDVSQQVGARPLPPSQQPVVRGVVQPQPLVRALPQSPQRSVAPVAQPQPIARTIRAPQAVVRPVAQPQPLANSVQWRQQAVVRTAAQRQVFARAMPQPQQGRILPASQAHPFAHAAQPRQQAVARSAPQPVFARPMPQSHQVFARPAALRQPIARPMPQRPVAQPSYHPAPRAQMQAHADRGPASRPMSGRVTSRS